MASRIPTARLPVRSDLLMSKSRVVFERVRRVGLSLRDVDATTKYDGSPILKLGGCFMAGLATHRSRNQARSSLDASRKTRTVIGGFTRRLLHHRSLSKLSGSAGSVVPSRPKSPTRSTFRFASSDGDQGTKEQVDSVQAVRTLAPAESPHIGRESCGWPEWWAIQK